MTSELNIASVKKLFQIGTKVHVQYMLGAKDLGELEIEFIHSKTIAFKADYTSTIIYLPNPFKTEDYQVIIETGTDVWTGLPVAKVKLFDLDKLVYTYRIKVTSHLLDSLAKETS